MCTFSLFEHSHLCYKAMKNTEASSDMILHCCLMSTSMIDTYCDDFGLLDFRRSQHGSGMSSRSQVTIQSLLYSLS